MQRLDLIVDQYLEFETDYALLMTGAWGTGKTHYFNQTIKPIIENKGTLKDKSKKYKLIIISLFGLKSIGEIQTQILLSSYSLFKNPKSRAATTLLGTFAKGLLNFTGVNAESIDTSIWAEALNQIKGFENLVICFDDIERKSPELEISQFIGFVNLLIENHGTKIILIANESKIDNFDDSKEKVIGNTIEYTPDYEDIFDNIIKSIFARNTAYTEFLSYQKELILDIFNKTTKNLRTLKYGLNQFLNIYSEIESLCNREEKLFKNSKDEILKETLKFILIISEEYRTGQISFSEKKELDNLDSYTMMMARELYNMGKKVEETEEPTYLRLIHDKYYSFSNNYKYFDSIYSFVTGGEAFDILKLRNEIINIFRINEEGLTLPQYGILNLLSWDKVYKLENIEYKSLTSRMLDYANRGEYQNLSEYATVFYYALRFNNIFSYSPDTLVQKLKVGIKKAKIKSVDLSIKYYPSNFKNIKEDDIYREQKENLFQFILDENRKLELSSKKDETKQLEEECRTDISSFCQKFYSEYSIKILEEFSPHIFYSAYIKSNNDSKHQVYIFMERAFNREPYYLSDIKVFLIGLKELFDKGSKQHVKKTLSGHYYYATKKLIEDKLKEIEK